MEQLKFGGDINGGFLAIFRALVVVVVAFVVVVVVLDISNSYGVLLF